MWPNRVTNRDLNQEIVVWAGDLFSTLHCIPPQLRGSDSLDDARLLYRLSCKGEPSGARPALGSSLACRLVAPLFGPDVWPLLGCAVTLPRRDEEDWLAENIAGSYRTTELP